MSEVNINDVVTPVASVPEERGIVLAGSSSHSGSLQPAPGSNATEQ